MDYEKAYKEALEQAKKELAVCGNIDCDAARLIFRLFPQLRENEDERMIKSITRLVKAFYDCNFPTPEGFERKDLFAWLKKQKEPKQECGERGMKGPQEIGDWRGDEGVCKKQKECLADNSKTSKSEDEKIREALIQYLKDYPCHLPNGLYSRDDFFIYLEKQKEQTSDIILKAFENSKTDYSLEEREEASDYSEKVLPTSITYGENEDEYRLHKIIEAAYIAGQKEQKPAIKLVFPKFRVGDIIRNVHDESDKTTKRISYVGEHGYNFDYRHLGDKAGGGSFGFCYEEHYEFVEQKPAEWSEEDEDKLEQCIRIVSGWERDYDIVKSPYSNFLKSLRPQPHWKPSEEQMKALDKALYYVPEEIGIPLAEIYGHFNKMKKKLM